MASLLEKVQWVVSDPVRRQSVVEWYGAKAMRRPAVLSIPSGGRISHFRKYSEFYGCMSQIPGPGERALVNRVVGPGSAALDIGAYIGVFSVILGKRAAGGRVDSFEPTPFMYEKLVRNLADNRLDHVNAFNLAVGESDGRVRFALVDAPMENKIVSGDGPADQSSVVEVGLVSIDSFCAAHGIDGYEFAKIDVEGAEPQVLRGARRMLTERRIKTILIEVCPENLASMGSSPAELHATGEGLGYHFFTLTTDGNPGARLDAEDLARFKIENVLMTPA